MPVAGPLPLSVQLYTLRDLVASDLPGTVKRVAEIGYRGVELAGFGNLKTAQEVRKALDDAGIVASGAHVAIESFEADVDKVMDDYDAIGTKLLIVPWLDPKLRGNDAAAWRALAAQLSAHARTLAARGFTLAYHNHDFEFQKYDGEHALDILWQHADPALVKCELDLFWVKYAGVDPLAYLRKVGSRVVSVHLKDQDRADPKRFTQVGRGTLDFPAILKACNELGVKWGVVEQDNCYDVPPLESVRISYEYLTR